MRLIQPRSTFDKSLTPENLFALRYFRNLTFELMVFTHQITRLLPLHKQCVFGLGAVINQLRYELEAILLRHPDNFCRVCCDVESLAARHSIPFFHLAGVLTNLSAIRSYLYKLMVSWWLCGSLVFRDRLVFIRSRKFTRMP